MRRDRGSILVLVLFILTVLSLLAVSLSYRAGIALRTARHRAIRSELKAQAASAAALAIARLAENTNEFDHRAEPWHAHAALDAAFHSSWLAEGEEGATFATSYQVTDEEAKLHALFASTDELQKLGMSPEQIAALTDWMDADDDMGAGGAENDFYLNRPSPYACKNAPLELLEELLLVRGFSSTDFSGEDLDRDGELDASEDDGLLTLPLDNADGVLRQGWVDLLTCHGDGRINLNTAPLAVLQTLPLSEGAPSQIVAYRAFDAASGGNLEDHAFITPDDIDQLQGLSDADKALLQTVSIFKSGTFRVFAQARHLPTGLRYDTEVLLRIGPDGPEFVHSRGGTP